MKKSVFFITSETIVLAMLSLLLSHPAFSFPQDEPKDDFKLETTLKLPYVLTIFINGAISSINSGILSNYDYKNFEIFKKNNENAIFIHFNDSKGQQKKTLLFSWDHLFYTYKIHEIKSAQNPENNNELSHSTVTVFDISEAVNRLLSYHLSELSSFAKISGEGLPITLSSQTAAALSKKFPDDNSSFLGGFLNKAIKISQNEKTPQNIQENPIVTEGYFHALDAVFKFLLFNTSLPSDSEIQRAPMYSVESSEKE